MLMRIPDPKGFILELSKECVGLLLLSFLFVTKIAVVVAAHGGGVGSADALYLPVHTYMFQGYMVSSSIL